MMKRNMTAWIEQMRGNGMKKPLPVLSFPCISLLGVTVRELISDSAPFGRRYYKNTRILTGHVPTHRLSPTHRGKIIRSPYQIALDCGAHEGIALGCYCMDSGEEFYVSL